MGAGLLLGIRLKVIGVYSGDHRARRYGRAKEFRGIARGGVRSTEYRVRSSEYRVQSTEFGVQSTEFGVQITEDGGDRGMHLAE
jgi:hypothetical protein